MTQLCSRKSAHILAFRGCNDAGIFSICITLIILPTSGNALRFVAKAQLQRCRIMQMYSPPSPTPNPPLQAPVTEEERVAKARAEVTRRIKALGAKGRVKEATQQLASLAQLGIQPDTQVLYGGCMAFESCADALTARCDGDVLSCLFRARAGPPFLQRYSALPPPAAPQPHHLYRYCHR